MDRNSDKTTMVTVYKANDYGAMIHVYLLTAGCIKRGSGYGVGRDHS